jgi:hypothetical protein
LLRPTKHFQKPRQVEGLIRRVYCRITRLRNADLLRHLLRLRSKDALEFAAPLVVDFGARVAALQTRAMVFVGFLDRFGLLAVGAVAGGGGA